MGFNLGHLLGRNSAPVAGKAAKAAQQQQVYTQAQQQQMTPVGQPIPKAFMDSFSPQTRQLAELYQSNPTDPRVMNLDPKMFGYAPDNTVHSSVHNNRLAVAPHHNFGPAPNLGVSSSPLQGGFGMQPQGVGGMPTDIQPHQLSPVFRPQRPTFNPQVKDNGYYWNN